jgi:rare lipoprotein A
MNRVILVLFMMLATTNMSQAGFLDDVFAWNAPQETAHKGKHGRTLNNYSTGAHNASWYNDRSGRTASGMRATYGVAHRSLPFGTRVLITNPANGRQITAVVTDRGPFVRGRTLDVNQNVANALGFKSHGTARLHMEVQ